MKKTTVIIISIISILAFSWLVYYGFSRRHGFPVEIENVKEKTVLSIPFIEKKIDLAAGLETSFWADIEKKKIDLVPQLMVLPWPNKNGIKEVEIAAFHNNNDIYFYFEWEDETEDRDIGNNTFSDACAVMFPLGENVKPSSIMMGFEGIVNIWHLKASLDKEFWLKKRKLSKTYADYHYPFEDEELFAVSKAKVISAVNDILSIRVSTVTQKQEQKVEGRCYWKNNKWTAVIKRSLNASNIETDATFNFREDKLCAFAVWNGSNGDRGGKKSISDWVKLEVLQ